MKKILLILPLFLVLLGCSKDKEDEMDLQNLIIGEWYEGNSDIVPILIFENNGIVKSAILCEVCSYIPNTGDYTLNGKELKIKWNKIHEDENEPVWMTYTVTMSNKNKFTLQLNGEETQKHFSKKNPRFN